MKAHFKSVNDYYWNHCSHQTISINYAPCTLHTGWGWRGCWKIKLKLDNMENYLNRTYYCLHVLSVHDYICVSHTECLCVCVRVFFRWWMNFIVVSLLWNFFNPLVCLSLSPNGNRWNVVVAQSNIEISLARSHPHTHCRRWWNGINMANANTVAVYFSGHLFAL